MFPCRIDPVGYNIARTRFTEGSGNFSVRVKQGGARRTFQFDGSADVRADRTSVAHSRFAHAMKILASTKPLEPLASATVAEKGTFTASEPRDLNGTFQRTDLPLCTVDQQPFNRLRFVFSRVSKLDERKDTDALGLHCGRPAVKRRRSRGRHFDSAATP